MKINWKVRFNTKNKVFIMRFVNALFIPAIVYFGLKVEDLTSWSVIGNLILRTLSNPYILGLMAWNAVNILSDPTTKGFGDSEKALEYEDPK